MSVTTQDRSSALVCFRPSHPPAAALISEKTHGMAWGRLLSGAALAAFGLRRGAGSGLAMAAVGAGLLADGLRKSRGYVGPGRGLKFEESITILRDRKDLYAFWRRLEQLPKIMRHLDSVTVLDDTRSHWVAKGPAGLKVEWDAEICTDVPGELISWRAIGDSIVDTAGSVHFRDAPGNRGTEIFVVLRYDVPGGRLADAIARLFGSSPEQEMHDDLRRFKQTIEAGAPPTVEGQARGTCRGSG